MLREHSFLWFLCKKMQKKLEIKNALNMEEI